jgi:cytoskeletal protein CcmA (bactofilin family)
MAESGEMTVIGADTHIKGEMTFERAAKINGKFEGRITAKGELQVSDGALCKAAVEAGNVVVDGSVEGDINAKERVSLNAKARMQGDLVAGRLIVAEGASLFGHVAVGPDAGKNAPSTRQSPPPPQPEAPKDPGKK